MFTIIKASFHNLQQSFFKRSELSPTDKKIAKLSKKISMLRASNETMRKHSDLYQKTVTRLSSHRKSESSSHPKSESIFQKDRREEWQKTARAKKSALNTKISNNQREITALEEKIRRMQTPMQAQTQGSTAQIARPSQPPLKSILKKEIQAGNRPPQNNQIAKRIAWLKTRIGELEKTYEDNRESFVLDLIDDRKKELEKYGEDGTFSDHKTPKTARIHKETLEPTQKPQRCVKKNPPKPTAALFSTRPARPVGAQANALFS